MKICVSFLADFAIGLAMPRKARIDAPGALHHIICRGIERRQVFESDADRDDFVARLSRIVTESVTSCYAWALLPNHFHLLLRTGNVPISTVMRRLLTGYAVGFNRRHCRQGRLFQNRYKSILCQQETYLLELVRYIHLNPLRAGLVETLGSLDRYAYSGHCRIMGTTNDGWQAVGTVLSLYGKQIGAARRQYRQFVQKGIAQGQKPELTGGGLLRSAGGWGVLKSKRRMKAHLKGDERILGNSAFVETVLGQAQEKLDRHYRMASAGYTLDTIIDKVGAVFDLPPEALRATGKHPRRVQARSLVAYMAVKQLGMQGTSVGRHLGLSQSAVSRAVQRGETLAEQLSFSMDEERNA